jgi:hypothetical protein
MLIRKLLFLSFLVFTALKSQAQVAISYYQSGLSMVGVSTNTNKRIWGELRLGTDLKFEDFSPELVGAFNFKKTETVKLYGGLGIRLNVYEGVLLPLGIQISPFQDFRNFAFHIEVAPIITLRDEYDSYFRGSVGIRYLFLRKKE